MTPDLFFFFFCYSSLPPGFEENLEVQGELILQDSFQVWDPRSLIRKGRDRHLFLFEFSLVFSKEIKDSAGRTKYQYKNRLLVSARCYFDPVHGERGVTAGVLLQVSGGLISGVISPRSLCVYT